MNVYVKFTNEKERVRHVGFPLGGCETKKSHVLDRNVGDIKEDEMITINNFSEHNRDIKIGNSLYRICCTENKKMWYIHEVYNDGNEFATANAYHSENLQEVIDKINSFTTEKEVVSLRLGKG